MRLLAQRVPLTLLLDLLAPPDAEELYRHECRMDAIGDRLAELEA